MSIKTTHNIAKQTAIAIIASKVHTCTDEEIADMLECLNESTFRNYYVLDELPEEDDYTPSIRTVEQFNVK